MARYNCARASPTRNSSVLRSLARRQPALYRQVTHRQGSGRMTRYSENAPGLDGVVAGSSRETPVTEMVRPSRIPSRRARRRRYPSPNPPAPSSPSASAWEPRWDCWPGSRCSSRPCGSTGAGGWKRDSRLAHRARGIGAHSSQRQTAFRAVATSPGRRGTRSQGACLCLLPGRGLHGRNRRDAARGSLRVADHSGLCGTAAGGDCRGWGHCFATPVRCRTSSKKFNKNVTSLFALCCPAASKGINVMKRLPSGLISSGPEVVWEVCSSPSTRAGRRVEPARLVWPDARQAAGQRSSRAPRQHHHARRRAHVGPAGYR